MHRRIAFYQKNGMQLSGVTCNFYDNEYRIMYAGAHCEDTKVQEITMNTYLNFSVQMLSGNVRYFMCFNAVAN